MNERVHDAEGVLGDYLLAATTPSIRYLTLTRLLNVPLDDPQTVAEQESVMTTGPVPRILAAQTDDGSWRSDNTYYSPKYRSTHWSMLLLDELAVDGSDGRFRRGASFMLDAAAARLQNRFQRGDLGWSCLGGNIIRYAVHAGLATDPRLEFYLQYARQDLANGCCRCAYNGGLACAWGVTRTLWGLAALPPTLRSPALQTAMDDAVAFLTAPGTLVSAVYPTAPDGKVHSLWHRLNFPLFYQADILFTLRVLADMDALAEPGAQEALGWLAEKRDKNGRWRGSSPFGSRTWSLGHPPETDRWVTLWAAVLLDEA
jgi:hypothetical protein